MVLLLFLTYIICNCCIFSERQRKGIDASVCNEICEVHVCTLVAVLHEIISDVHMHCVVESSPSFRLQVASESDLVASHRPLLLTVKWISGEGMQSLL